MIHSVLIMPTSDGVHVSVDGVLHHKPLNARQLLDYARRFADAAAERLYLESRKAEGDQ